MRVGDSSTQCHSLPGLCEWHGLPSEGRHGQRLCVLQWAFQDLGLESRSSCWSVGSAPRFWVRCLEIVLTSKGCDFKRHITRKQTWICFIQEYHNIMNFKHVNFKKFDLESSVLSLPSGILSGEFGQHSGGCGLVGCQPGLPARSG